MLLVSHRDCFHRSLLLSLVKIYIWTSQHLSSSSSPFSAFAMVHLLQRRLVSIPFFAAVANHSSSSVVSERAHACIWIWPRAVKVSNSPSIAGKNCRIIPCAVYGCDREKMNVFAQGERCIRRALNRCV